MSIDPNVSVAANGLVDRAKNILLTPGAEFDRIAAEPADTGKLYTGYLLPLAALAALCGFIGMSVFGVSGFGIAYKVPLVTGLVSAIVQVVMAVVGAFVLAFITNALAPTFGSQQDINQAHKLSVYSATASLLSGVFMIFPPLAVLGILGLYSLALLYIGLPRLMKTPEDKRIGYFITIIIVAIVVWLVIGWVTAAARMAMPGGSPGMPGGMTFGQHSTETMPDANVQGSVSIPGGGQIDLGELEKMGQAYSSGAASGEQIDPARLQAFLPASLPGGFTQVSTSASSTGAMGANVAQAEAVYQRGDARMTVTVVHMGAMGGIASMAGAMNVQENTQTADGYSRTQTSNGRVISEEYNRSSNHASYGVVGRGVALTAEGDGVTADEARAVVEAIGIERVEAVAS